MTVPTNPVGSSLPELFFTDQLDPGKTNPSIFIYAIAGAGKTNALRSLVTPGSVTGKVALEHPPLVLATEDGQTKGMATLGDLHLPAILLNNLTQLMAVIAEISASSKPGELYYNKKGPFGALACDSVTGVGPWLEDASKKMKNWDSIWGDVKGQGGKDPRTAYPYIAEKGREIVRKMLALPAPVILTCREQVFTDQETKTSWAAPELPGQKLPMELPGWPEATVRLRMINGVRQFVTENEGNVVARVRLKAGARVPKFCKPDLGALLRVMRGDMDALKDLALPAPAVK